jgi:hypothetical protein
MATGQPLPARSGGVHGAVSDAGAASVVLNSAAPCYRGRIEMLWIYSTSVTVSTTPSGWTQLWTGQVTGFRGYLYWHPAWPPTDNTTNSTWALSAAAPWVINGNDWEGLDAAPLVGTPVTASGATATASIPSLTLPYDNCLVMWWWAARWATSASSRTITVPADLNSLGNVTSTSTGVGVSGRCGGWTNGNGQDTAPLRSPLTTGAKAAALSATPTSWSGLAVPFRLAQQPGLSPLLAA